jgi:hypothetical protein
VSKTCDEFPPPGSTRDGWGSGCRHEPRGLLTGRGLPKMPHGLKEPAIPGQGLFAHATKHSQRRLA